MEEIKDKPKQLALGLDLGVASCGWSLLDITDPNNMQLVDLGVRLFDEASSNGDTKAAERRGKRSLRRRLRRLRFKKHNLLHLFAEYNLVDGQNFDEKVDNACKIIEGVDDSINVIDLKLKGLNEPLSNQELIITLYSYMQHRGYFYEIEEENAKKPTEEQKANLNDIKKQLKTKFPSQIQKEHQNEFGKFMGLDSNSQFSNKDWTKEIEALFAHQDQNKVTNEFQKVYLDLFNYIRPFNIGPGGKDSPTPYGLYRKKYDEKTKEYKIEKIGANLWDVTMGKCSVYPDLNREYKSAPLTELFNLVNDVNNIKAICEGKMLPLSIDQKKIFYEEVDKLLLKDALKNKTASDLISSATLLKIIKKACSNDDLEFKENSIVGIKVRDKVGSKKQEAVVDSTKFTYAISSFLRDCGLIKENDLHLIKDNQFNKDLIDKLQEIFNVLVSAPQDKQKRLENLIKYLKDHQVDNKNELAEKLIELLKSGFSSTAGLSSKAMLQFIDNNWNKELNQSSYFHDQIMANVKKDIPNTKYLAKNLFSKEILSTNAKRIYIQAINVINKILKLWCYKKGYQLASITIEMPRDKNSSEEKKLITKFQKENKAFKEHLIKDYHLTEEDLNSGQKFLKAYLWEQQDHCDLYDGSEIKDLNKLLHSPSAYQIDHAIPYSISGIDSLANKVLTSTENNREKGNRTPFQWLSGNQYKEFKDRVIKLYQNKKIDSKKRDYLLREETNWEGFIGRNLSDTRYGTKVLLNTLQAFFEKNISNNKTRIIATNGSMTHYARSNLFVDANGKPLILDKDRLINNHHAIDATIIAYLGNNQKIKNILEWYRKKEDNPSYVKELTDPMTGEVMKLDDENDIRTFYGLKSKATQLLGEQLERINNNTDDKFYVKFSRPIITRNNFGFFDDTIYGYKKDGNQEYAISKINLLTEIDDKTYLKWKELYFSNDTESAKLLLIKINDPIYIQLKKIFNKPEYIKTSKESKIKHYNPFLNYLEELNQKIKTFIPIYKDGIYNEKRFTKVRFLRIKEKISNYFALKNRNRLGGIKQSLKPSYVRLYKNKDGKIVPINITVRFLKFDGKKQETYINDEALNKELIARNIEPNSNSLSLYYGNTFLLNNKFIEDLNNFPHKQLGKVINNLGSNLNYLRIYCLGSFNEGHNAFEVKILNVSAGKNDDSVLTAVIKDRFFLKVNFMQEYVDLIELDPLGNIYNRKSFKEIFNELGTTKNN